MAGLPGAGAPGVTVPVPGDKTGDKGGDKGKRDANLGVQRAGYGGGSTGSGRTVLTMEDLGMAVGEYGVTVRRGEWYR
jgi:transcription initiation factor TFIID subunit 10